MKYLSTAMMRNWPAEKRLAVLSAAVRQNEVVVELEDGEFVRLASSYGLRNRENNVVLSRENIMLDVEAVKQRFSICRACDDAEDEGHACRHYGACCFGAWRAKRTSKCPIGKW